MIKSKECLKYNYKNRGGSKKVKKNLFRGFIPMITMLVIFILSVIFKLKGVFILGLVAGSPISLFIQGIVCSRKSMGWIMPLVTLLITFFTILMWVMRDYASVYLYLKYYAIAYILGYILEKLISVLKNKLK